MKLPDSLSGLSNATLVLAAGAIDARMYMLQNGTVVGNEEVRRDKAALSDRESSFTNGGGAGSGSGASSEIRQEEKTHKAFLKDLAHHISEFVSDYAVEKVLLFAPAEYFSAVRNALPTVLRGRVFHEGKGNYAKHDVVSLLKHVKENADAEEAVQRENMAPEEAKKILGKNKTNGNKH